ncbi:hypothetical protein BDZ91DRAFT_740170 [Kalaharituber pfeilii]|nr:hypothetical protein BDZ91DRAFT_740170 [Kalaharituber pfeilii]
MDDRFSSPSKPSWISRLILRIERTALQKVERKFVVMLQHFRQLTTNSIEDVQKDVRDLQRQLNQLQSKFSSSRTVVDGHYDLASASSGIHSMHHTYALERNADGRCMGCKSLLSNTPALPRRNVHNIMRQSNNAAIDLNNGWVPMSQSDYSQLVDAQAIANINQGISTKALEPPGLYEREIVVQPTRQASQDYGYDPTSSLIDIPNFIVDTTNTPVPGLGSPQNFVPTIIPYRYNMESQGSSTTMHMINFSSCQPSAIVSGWHEKPAEQNQEKGLHSERKDGWFKCRFESCSMRKAERSDNFRKHLKTNHKTELRNCLGCEPHELRSDMGLVEIINYFGLGDASMWRVPPPRKVASGGVLV